MCIFHLILVAIPSGLILSVIKNREGRGVWGWGVTERTKFVNKNKTTTTFILMPLSWLARVGNFCFNLLSPFLLIKCILSSQAISFQILLYTLFPQFPWSIFLLFSSYFMGVEISTYVDLHNTTHPIPKNISRHPTDQPQST